jgi:hypothetical protein
MEDVIHVPVSLHFGALVSLLLYIVMVLSDGIYRFFAYLIQLRLFWLLYLVDTSFTRV